MAKVGRKKSYDSYVRQYKAKERKLNANGVQMSQRILTSDEFEAQYNRILNSRKKEVSEGKRKTTGNITRDLIDKQAYTISQKQYEALVKGSTLTGNYYQNRSGLTIVKAETDFVDEYMESNPTADFTTAITAARKRISAELFGS